MHCENHLSNWNTEFLGARVKNHLRLRMFCFQPIRRHALSSSRLAKLQVNISNCYEAKRNFYNNQRYSVKYGSFGSLFAENGICSVSGWKLPLLAFLTTRIKRWQNCFCCRCQHFVYYFTTTTSEWRCLKCSSSIPHLNPTRVLAPVLLLCFQFWEKNTHFSSVKYC